ncbi:hypothetical protein BGZ65_006007 [Modicella reniformis]|uniref:PEP5/VPS11 N-terminal domain-containing protein n=1 Tax=Modicella reniformis TaxID=1440133 RepID=A0A9P6SVQ1_9FUNG|nr:hypothetical protein BGZ65_006007 [Modicella reniformis]
MNETTQELAIAREEAIFFYGPDGRGSAYGYDGSKTFISFYKSYLVLVSPPNINITASRTFGVHPAAVSANDTTRLTILDTANKFTAYQDTFMQGIRSVIYEWGSIYIIDNGERVYRLDETDTSEKLDILFKNNMYLLAIKLAHNQKYDNTSISEIIRKYGDYLYDKGDYDGAMSQYVRTIGRLEPSYVIRKFLDAQRIYSLTSYLQELHSSGLANKDHTTLLLNCYTKLKDVKRLDKFIKTDSDLNFDLETAIQVCRQAQYYEHAVYLAERFDEHDLYLTVQIDDMKECDRALAYMRHLGSMEADKNLQKYGKILLAHLPEQTTELLVDLCSGALITTTTFTGTSGTASPVPSNVNHANHAFSMLPFALSGPGGSSTPPINPVTSSGAASPSMTSQATFPTSSKVRMSQHLEPPKNYAPPSPRLFMSLFVDHPSFLITFLERVSENRWPPSPPVGGGGGGGGGAHHQPPGSSGKSPRIVPSSARPGGNIGNAGNNDSLSVGGGSGSGSGRKMTVGSADMNEKASTTGGSTGRHGATAATTAEQDMEERKAIWNTLLELYLADPSLNPSPDHGRGSSKFSTMQVAQMNRKTMERNIRKEKCLKLLNDTEIPIMHWFFRMKMYTDILRLWIEKDNTNKVIECLGKYGPLEPSLYPLTLSYFSSSNSRLVPATKELLNVLDHIDKQDLLPPLQVVLALSQTSVATIDTIKSYITRRIETERRERQEDQRQIQSYRQESERKRREIEELKTSARVFQATKCSACGGSLDLPALEDADDGFAVIAKYFGNNTFAFARLIDSLS